MHYYPVFLVKSTDAEDARDTIINELMETKEYYGCAFDYFDEQAVVAAQGSPEFDAMLKQANDDRARFIAGHWKECRKKLLPKLKRASAPKNLPFLTEILNDIRRLLDGEGATGCSAPIEVSNYSESGSVFAVKVDLHW